MANESKFFHKKRRAVGGLISLVALILVFGIVSLAFLDINSMQTKFTLNGIEVNNAQFEKTKEHLNFTITNTTSDKGYEITVENIWSEQTTIESHITVDNFESVVFTRYLNDTSISGNQNILNPSSEKLLNFTDSNSTHNDSTIYFTTLEGNKCVIPIPAEGATLTRDC